MKCSWCNTDTAESAKVHEGPHATWCPRYSLTATSEPIFDEAGDLIGLKTTEIMTREEAERRYPVVIIRIPDPIPWGDIDVI